jgi:hypothetical protein
LLRRFTRLERLLFRAGRLASRLTELLLRRAKIAFELLQFALESSDLLFDFVDPITRCVLGVGCDRHHSGKDSSQGAAMASPTMRFDPHVPVPLQVERLRGRYQLKASIESDKFIT